MTDLFAPPNHKWVITHKKVFLTGIGLFIIGSVSIFVLQDYPIFNVFTPIVCGAGTMVSIVGSVELKSKEEK